MDAGQQISIDGFGQLLKLTYIPRKSDKESAVIFDFLRAHLYDFTALAFSVPVGQGTPPDPTHAPGIQKTTVLSSQKRIDVLAWQGDQPWIVEAKQRIEPGALGQLHAYSLLWQQENPNARTPKLVAIGRTCDADTLGVLAAHGVDVYLYAPPAGDGGATNGSLPAVNATP